MLLGQLESWLASVSGLVQKLIYFWGNIPILKRCAEDWLCSLEIQAPSCTTWVQKETGKFLVTQIYPWLTVYITALYNLLKPDRGFFLTLVK